jgi:NADH dehydrogenase [ubiquinone] 1 alpha subcomplex assembly factor 7
MISVADYMAEANAHYYAARDPLGVQGDFITAPEISQMFGELIGVCLADLWLRAGKPAGAHYVELGPGRGTLAQDALRAMRTAGFEPAVELVEPSPALRDAQAERLPEARWHGDLATLPPDGPWLVVANEFFDALPIRQFDRSGEELMVRLDGERFVRDAAAEIVERSPASEGVVQDVARRVRRQGGAALIVDYGYEGPAVGDTLQSVARHAYADPWEEPGARDLTAHIDFSALAAVARDEGVQLFGPVTQGDWLEAMGLHARSASLARSAPERADEIKAAHNRLLSPSEMGRLFKVMALVAPDWPRPAGFP